MSWTQNKEQVEAQIAAMVASFEQEQTGRGPSGVRVWILEDLILIRLEGMLTPAEKRLNADPSGRYLLQLARTGLVTSCWSVLEDETERLTGVSTVGWHDDLIIQQTGERILVLSLAENLEAKFGS